MNNTVTGFGYDPHSGILTAGQTISTLPSEWQGTSYAADLQMSPDGRFLYVSNRGHDSLAIVAVEGDPGTMEVQEFVPVRGRWPRQFRLSPDGRFLLVANQESNAITVFAVDPANGHLTAVGEPVSVPAPVCITFC